MAYSAPSPQELIARADRMASERGTFDAHAEQVRELSHPTAKSFTTTGVPGEKVHDKVFDSTPETTNDFLAAGLQAVTCNPGTDWFGLTFVDDRVNAFEPAALWLEHVRDRMTAMFNSPKSHFSSQQHEKYLELTSIGTGVMFVGDRPGRVPTEGGVLFSARPLAECYITEDADGEVNTLYRRFELTARQAFDKWGAAAGPKVAEAAVDSKRQDGKVKFLHCVEPRAGAYRGGLDVPRGKKPFASYVVNVDEKLIVEEDGFDEFPYTVPRWSKRPGETYGRGPGMKTLADARMLQRMMKTTIRGAEKIVDPPLLVADDGVMVTPRVMPAGITPVRWEMMQGAAAPVRPLLTGGRPDLGEEIMAGVRGRIEQGNYKSLFEFARNPNMTATQYLGILDQIQQMLNPIIGRMRDEDLGKLIDRSFAIMLRAGAFEPPPPEIAGQPFRAEYVSPVAKSQRVSEVKAIAQTIDVLTPIGQIKPDIWDNFDTDAVARGVADLSGVRKDWMRGADKVGAIRDGRIQTQEQQAKIANMETLATAGAAAAKGVKHLTDAGAAANGAAQPQGAAA